MLRIIWRTFFFKANKRRGPLLFYDIDRNYIRTTGVCVGFGHVAETKTKENIAFNNQYIFLDIFDKLLANARHSVPLIGN